MSFTKVSFVEPTSAVETPSNNKICIIGDGGTFSGVIDEVSTVNQLTDEGVGTATPLYKSVEYALECISSSDINVIAAGIPETGETYNNVEWEESDDSGQYYTSYAPISSVSNAEILISQAQSGISGKTGWFDIVSGAHLSNDRIGYGLTGSISGFAFDSGGTIVRNYQPLAADKIRSTIAGAGAAVTFKTLLSDDYNFDFFAFAYDASQGADRWDSANTVFGVSWLNDVQKGASMCNQFRAAQKRTKFVCALPDRAVLNSGMGRKYASGTTYSGTIFSQIRNVVGQNNAIICGRSNKVDDSESDDCAIALMISEMAYPARSKIMYKQPAAGNYTQVNNPDSRELKLWNDAHVIPLGLMVGSDVQRWMGIKTFGSYNTNHSRCRDILGDRTVAALNSLVATTQVGWNKKGMNTIRSTILQTQRNLVNEGIIDSVGSVTIPIETAVIAVEEGTANASQTASVSAAKDSGVLTSVESTYGWDGDIYGIQLTFSVA